jgi:heme exporter protein C
MKKAAPLLMVATVAALAFGFWQAMFVAPTEATMGNIQRIFYYHVPSAWTAFLLFFANFVASIIYLFRRSPAMDALALAAAEVGVVFCTVVLITGPIWARPVWGIWWTWDARLTTTLVLWLIYVSYLMLRHFSDSVQMPLIAAALAIFAFIDVPIVYMSIRWWRTQHPQPVIAGGEGSGLDPAMWHALLWNWLAFGFLAACEVAWRYSIARRGQRATERAALAALEEAS